MAYQRKTKDEWQVHVNYGYGDGWEEVCASDSETEARNNLRAFRENCPEYPSKLVCKYIPK